MKDSTRIPIVLHHPYDIQQPFYNYQKHCGVYVLLNRQNGKAYIGSGLDLGQRWMAHRAGLRAGRHHSAPLQKDYQDNCGYDFTVSMIEECLPQFIADREQYWLNVYKTASPDRGYNVSVIAKHRVAPPKTKIEKTLPNGRTLDIT